MTLFDLLFLGLALLTVVLLLQAAVLPLRGHRARADRILGRLGLGAAGYFAVLIIVSFLSPQRTLPMGAPQCADDWCIAVTGAERDSPSGHPYEVTFRVSSRARRVTQRERFVVAYLRDAAGTRYDADSAPDEPPFDVALGPGDAVTTHRRFAVPATARRLGVVIAREGAGGFPGCCIIGDEGSLFHKRSVVLLHAP